MTRHTPSVNTVVADDLVIRARDIGSLLRRESDIAELEREITKPA
jgi:hypothetical protein